MAKGKKTGGRKKGTPNRLTYQSRLILLEALDGEIEELPNLLAELPPKERLEILCKLLPYVLPKITPSSAKHADQLGLVTSSDAITQLSSRNEKEQFFEQMLAI